MKSQIPLIAAAFLFGLNLFADAEVNCGEIINEYRAKGIHSAEERNQFLKQKIQEFQGEIDQESLTRMQQIIDSCP